MFLQGSDLLHACNGTRSTLHAVLSIIGSVSLELPTTYFRQREEREEKSFDEGVRLTQDIYPMYSQSSKARKNNKGASLGGKCQVRKCNPLVTKLVGTPSISFNKCTPFGKQPLVNLGHSTVDSLYFRVIQLHSMDLRSLLCPIALN